MNHHPSLIDRDLLILDRAVKAYQATLTVLGELEMSTELKHESAALSHTWSLLALCRAAKCDCRLKGASD